MKRGFYFLLGIIAVFFGITFALKNPQSAEISYYLGLNFSAPLSVILLVVFMAGVLIGYFVGLGRLFKVQGELDKARQQKQLVDKALAESRVMTIRDVV